MQTYVNPYIQHIEKIEFVVTDACTGRCKHCAEGDHSAAGASIDPLLAADAVKKIAGIYDVRTVMAFGGEPLLCPDAVVAIMEAATAVGVPRRQVITNGYFSKNPEEMRRMAERLAASGVNDLLLSVDAFHQETIPLDVVKGFAVEIVRAGIPLRLSPAWLVHPTDENPYNRKTREILREFEETSAIVGEGNTIFPEGNAVKYLSAYFENSFPENPYVEDPRDVRCVSFSANGDVLSGNIYREDILEILRTYTPEEKEKRREDRK